MPELATPLGKYIANNSKIKKTPPALANLPYFGHTVESREDSKERCITVSRISCRIKL